METTTLSGKLVAALVVFAIAAGVLAATAPF